MRTVRLGRTFDAVLIHDAIGYMTTEADLRAAFETAETHLRPGGVFITSPDFFREDFRDPAVETATHTAGETSLDVPRGPCGTPIRPTRPSRP